jgi:hypothetical protein
MERYHLWNGNMLRNDNGKYVKYEHIEPLLARIELMAHLRGYLTPTEERQHIDSIVNYQQRLKGE